MIGSLLLFKKVNNVNSFLAKCLYVSSSIMLFISIFDLIPASFLYFNKRYDFVISIVIIAVYASLGAILVYIIDKKKKSSNNLYKIGIISMISLVLHNIPEGIITFLTTKNDLSLGLSLSISIALHNIPEGIAISIPIFYGDNNKKKALLYTLIAALSEPFGAFICYMLFREINIYLFAFILSLTSGIMIYLSIFELLKNGFKYDKSSFIYYYLLGITIMVISKLII